MNTIVDFALGMMVFSIVCIVFGVPSLIIASFIERKNQKQNKFVKPKGKIR